MNTPAEYREQARYDMAIPEFKAQTCEVCYTPNGGFIELNHHIYSNQIHTVVPYIVCADCIADVIQYRCRCRNVSDMTGELYRKHYKDLLNRVENL